MEAQNWINSILNSTEGHRQAIPQRDLWQHIQSRIAEYPRVSNRVVWLAAASLLLLIGLNLRALLQQRENKSQSVAVMASDINKSNQIYPNE